MEGPSRRQFLLAAAAASTASAAPAKSFQPDFASTTAAAEAIRLKRISSLELTELAFRRIDRHNPKLNAIVLQFREPSLERARKADEALARKQSWGPFHGVPITVKETFGMTGIATNAGVPQYKDFRPKRNAVAVDRLLDAGAIIIGKTNVPVMASDYQSYNPIYGSSNNPWDLARTPGGSTGGGGAALAAGMGHLTLGSDIGGSIRIPSHFCGVYGHKPTLELVSTRGHVPPMIDPAPARFVDLVVAGPLARTAGDLHAAMQVLGGPNGDEAKAWKWTMPAPRRTRLREFRVGCMIDDPYCTLSSEVKPALENAVAAIQKAGARVERGWPAGVVAAAQQAAYHSLLMSALGLTNDPHAAWKAATGQRLAARAIWQSYFETHDVFLMPVAFVPAFPHDHTEPMQDRKLNTPEGPRPYLDIVNWIVFGTLTGGPATVAPVGRTASGLPVGIQILGPYLEDATPIEFAALLADVVGGFEPPPAFA